MASKTCSKHLRSPEETAQVAARLAHLLQPGDCVLLDGTLGTGKTHFARSLIQSVLYAPEDVPSPTFTLVQLYETQIGPVWHTDLYRVGSISEIEELGLAEAFETAVVLVEWPERLGDLQPANALTIALQQGPDHDSRELTAHWSDPSWDHRMKEWCA